jgi:DNA-binding GntR family transcriptional regulator
MPAPRKNQDLAGHAYQQMREAILQGHYAPGEPLFEVHLAAKLGMSRTPLREALKVLARDGFVQVVPARGYIVPHRSMDDLRELFELRESLEGMAARCAAVRATDASIAELEQLCVLYENEADWQQWATIGTRFHNVLVAAAQNDRMATILDSLKGQILHSRRSALYANQDRRDAAIREHRAILDAVRARDGAAAEALAREHVRLSYAATLSSYQSRPPANR